MLDKNKVGCSKATSLKHMYISLKSHKSFNEFMSFQKLSSIFLNAPFIKTITCEYGIEAILPQNQYSLMGL